MTKTKNRHLKGKGTFDYDYVNDILFFKVKNREYSHSIEFENFVFDIDTENFIVGIQIFEASKYLDMSKQALRNVSQWKFKTRVEEGKMEIRLFFEFKLRNKIIQKTPIIHQDSELPNSELIAVPV